MDQQLQILINREWIFPWGDRLMALVSNFGAWAPWLLGLLLIIAALGNFRFRAAILTAVLAVGLCDGIGVNLLKHAVARPRPSQVEPGVRTVELGAPPTVQGAHWVLPRIFGALSDPVVGYPLGNEPPEIPGMLEADRPLEGRSFPSGHAANNLAVATVLILFFPRRGWLCLPIALMVCYSRVYTGSHWPLDVLAGIIMGVLGGWIATTIVRLLWKRFAPRLAPRLEEECPDILVAKAGSPLNTMGGAA